MKRTLKALSALLSYPSADLQAAADEIRAALANEGALSRDALTDLDPLLRSLASRDLMALQEQYSDLFDGSRSLSLHLFEHVHGESRERGQALIDLAQEYYRHGFAIDGNELSDYLPLFVEFLSFLDPAQAKEWLARPAHVLAAMEQRLREDGSPYAAVFRALLALPGASADAEAVAQLRARMRAEDERSVDERWEDAPVSFSAPAAPTNPVVRIAARIRTRLAR